jgi:syntaxin 18
MESTLSSVLEAEKSLLEVSTLQTELIKNLAQQTELTDRLYEEAVGSVGEMGKANVQLKEAKRRGEEGRLFLLIFLIGASMALLFLDWYSS